MLPHEFQQAGLAYVVTDVSARPGTEAETLAHWLNISGRHWYRPLAMRGYAAPWFFLHDVGLIVLFGWRAIRPHASALEWNTAQQSAYDDYASYLGRLARLPLLDSTHRWLHDLGGELWRRGHSDEARAQAELEVTLAFLEWLLDTIEPAIGWRRLATDLRWQSSGDADAARELPIGAVPEAAARNLHKGLTPEGQNPPERPFINFLRQVVGTGDLLWRPADADAVHRRWFNEVAIRAAADYHGAVRTAGETRVASNAPLTPLTRIVPTVPIRTRALRPLDTALIERYLSQHQPTADDEIQMELEALREEQIVDVENPLRTFTEGLNGVARRGPLSAMIKRELADDDLFYAKFADNSLLYMRRPELLSVPYSFFMGILVDTSFNIGLPDGSSTRSAAKELALYLLDAARLIPLVAPGLPTDGYLFQFGDQGTEYQRAQAPELLDHYARLGLNMLAPGLDALPGEFLVNLTNAPVDPQEPWLLRSDVLAASYFNLTTLPGREQPPITSWDTTGVVYPQQVAHEWDFSMQTRHGSRLTGQLMATSGDSASLTIRLLGSIGTKRRDGRDDSENEPPPLQEVVAMRGQPVALDCELPAGSTVRLSLSATGYAPVRYRLNLRLTPGAVGLHIGPHLWPAVTRLAQVGTQRLAEREGQGGQRSQRSDREDFSLAHVALITSDAFEGETAAQVQRYIREEFETLAERVAIHVFRLSPSTGTVSWLLDRGEWGMMKPPQPESLEMIRGQSKIRIQFWRELRRDLQRLGE